MWPVVTILLAGIGIVSVFAAVAYGCAFRYGGTALGSLERASALVVWMLTALQMLITIGRSIPETAPAFVQGLFAVLSKLQFQGVVLSPSCTPGIVPFAAQWAQFSTVLAAYVLVALALVVQRVAARFCAPPAAAALPPGGAPPGCCCSLRAAPPAASALAPSCSLQCAVCVEWGVVVPLFYVARVALALLCVAYALFTLTALAMVTCKSQVSPCAHAQARGWCWLP